MTHLSNYIACLTASLGSTFHESSLSTKSSAGFSVVAITQFCYDRNRFSNLV